MFATNLVYGLNALFLTPVILVGVTAIALIVRLFGCLTCRDTRVHHLR